MIGYLKGSILRSSPEKLLLDLQGVGYEVHIPLTTYTEIQKLESSGPVGLFIFTHVREGAFELFGFWTEREKLLFEKLLAVSGIGPKLARVVLSGMPADDLLAALSAGDVVRLSTIPGIGKKTAQRMVVELKDRVAELAVDLPVMPARAADQDLVEALTGLGYKPAEAERAVALAREDSPDASFEDLLRSSLKRLSRA